MSGPGSQKEFSAVIVRLQADSILIIAKSEDDRDSLACWSGDWVGNAFVLNQLDAQTLCLLSLGPEQDVRREPINVTSRSPAPLNLISNFAHTPFELDEKRYASVEAFWQGLKYPNETRRKEIATLYGKEAMDAGGDAVPHNSFEYQGQTVRVGTCDHWRLMALACRAKFSQNEDAQQALIETCDRPLTHITRKDSRTIPGVIMAEIWMRIRFRLRYPAQTHVNLYHADWDPN